MTEEIQPNHKQCNIEAFERFVLKHKTHLTNSPENIERVCNAYIKNNIMHYQLFYHKFGHEKAQKKMYDDFDFLLKIVNDVLKNA